MQIIGPQVEPRLRWQELIAAIEAGHRLPRAEIGDLFLYRGADTLLDRAAWISGLGALVKVATICPANAAQGLPSVNGLAALFDDVTGLPAALIDFHLLTKWKTAGDSLLAASRLARPDAQNFLLVGAGTVAGNMVQAYRALWPSARFQVWSRSPASAAVLGLPVADDLQTAVGWADVICTATMARAALIRGEWLRAGQHLDLIGAYTPDMREVDDTAMSRARVFVDSRATTLHHIGEIMAPLASGALRAEGIIADYYDDPALFCRTSPDEITICKNGGGAHLDLMTARYILAAAMG
jgi:ornithine cyclodeaminase